jgi:hypothetical protein
MSEEQKPNYMFLSARGEMRSSGGAALRWSRKLGQETAILGATLIIVGAVLEAIGAWRQWSSMCAIAENLIAAGIAILLLVVLKRIDLKTEMSGSEIIHKLRRHGSVCGVAPIM